MKYSEAINREATKRALEGTDFQLGSKFNGKVYGDGSIYVDGEKQTLVNKAEFENLVAETNAIEWGLLGQATATFIMKAYMLEHIQRTEYSFGDRALTVVELPEGVWGFEAGRYGVASRAGLSRVFNSDVVDKVLSQINA